MQQLVDDVKKSRLVLNAILLISSADTPMNLGIRYSEVRLIETNLTVYHTIRPNFFIYLNEIFHSTQSVILQALALLR
jgi:hypothetical protein